MQGLLQYLSFSFFNEAIKYLKSAIYTTCTCIKLYRGATCFMLIFSDFENLKVDFYISYINLKENLEETVILELREMQNNPTKS